MRSRLRTWFIAGLIVFLPVVITFSIIVWLFRIVDGLLPAAARPRGPISDTLFFQRRDS